MNIKIESGSWKDLQENAKYIRNVVFIQEQNIAPEDEWDDFDHQSVHFIVTDDMQPIATARLLPNQSIGRVAVLKSYRGTGIGFKLMQQIIEFAKSEKRPFLILSAQVHAIQFYEKLGFKIKGDEYLDCNIPHIDMIMYLEN